MADKKQEFQVGDLVQLKSGGPKMTINSMIGNNYTCVWFAGTKHNKANFTAQALQPYIAPKVEMDLI